MFLDTDNMAADKDASKDASKKQTIPPPASPQTSLNLIPRKIDETDKSVKADVFHLLGLTFEELRKKYC